MMSLSERFIEALREPICDNCLGRSFGNLLSGMTNEQRGRSARTYVAALLDSGEKLNVYMPNFRQTRFRSIKPDTSGPDECSICKGFFSREIDVFVEKAAKKLREIEFGSFVVGSTPTDEMQNAEEKLWNRIGIDYVETMKSEINREVGKRIERATGVSFDQKSPDVLVTVDLKKSEARLQLKSLFISGRYQKLVRGIPQTKWVCMECMGKGCVECGGEGKRYKTSVQEIVGKPAEKIAAGKDNAFHGSGREDVDARCLGWRPFVIEVVRPVKRKIDLRKLERSINKSRKVKVSGLAFCDKEFVRKIKSDRHDKSYSAEVEFESDIDKKLLPAIRSLKGATISQHTPTRVKHRRADLLRRRGVVDISYKVLGKRKLRIDVRGHAGLYIKELINGDGGRTKPSVAEILQNRVKGIKLDVTRIWA